MDHDVQPLVEREAELALLESALSGAVASGRGQAILVDGEAGIGKSSLLDAAVPAARASGLRILSARGTPLEQDLAYGIARQLLLPVVLGAGEAECERLLSGAAGLARAALMEPTSNGAGPPGPEAAFATRHGLTWLVATLAGQGEPLAIVVDDAHWADPPSLRFLNALAAQAGELPVVLILAARPPAAWSDENIAAEVAAGLRIVQPGRLTVDGVRDTLSARLGTTPDDAFAAAAHAETRGTPYLVASLADALRRDAVEPVAANAEAIARLGTAAVGRYVSSRARSLPSDALAVARAIAVVGGGRPAAEIEQVAGVAPGTAMRVAGALEATGFVRGWPAPEFEHPLVRSAVLDDLAEAQRAELHDRAATLAIETGEADRAAAHLAEVPGRGDQARVGVLHAVGSRALRSGAPEVAIKHLRRALAEPADGPARVAVLMDLGAAESFLSVPGAADRLLAAAAMIPDPAMALRMNNMAGYTLSFAGRWIEAADRMRDGTDAAAATGAPADAVFVARIARAGVMLTCVPTGREAAALLDEIDREMPVDSTVRPILHRIQALRKAGAGYAREEVLDHVEAGMGDIDPALLDPPMRGVPLIARLLVDDFERADTALREVIDQGRRRGDLTVVQILSAWQGLNRVRAGRLAEADEALLAVEDSSAAPLPAIARMVAAVVRASAAFERGDIEAAAAATAEPLEHDPLIADTNFCDVFLVQRGRVLLARGDADGAYRLFTKAGASQERWGGDSPPMAQWRLAAGEAARDLGRLDEARALLDEEVAAAERLGAPRPLAMTLRAKATVAGSDDVAEELLRAALDVLPADGLDLQRAKTHAGLGALLVRTDRMDAAREELRVALDLAWAAGADRLAETVRAELVRAGARPRRPELTGLRALTAAEARTARMATEATNREIAETLFVTEKTVEAHLTSAYRKLGVTGRSQLAAALDVARGVSRGGVADA